MELKDLVGLHALEGVEVTTIEMPPYENASYTETCNCIKFTLDGVHYLAVEEPDDGYRTFMKELMVSDTHCRHRIIPGAQVMCVHFAGRDDRWQHDDLLRVIDVVTGEPVLIVGTEDVDDYYPLCILEYHPENLACNKGITQTEK